MESVERLGGENVGRERSPAKVALASSIGAAIEWYDFFLYGTAAGLVFNQLFFTNLDPAIGTLVAYLTFAAGFVDPRVGTLAGATRLFEEALLELVGDHGDGEAIPFEGGGSVLLHGHCHQKALVGTGPTERALSLAPGTDVEVVDSGCCGMAGLFGYEKGHYEVSMKMGERRLFPAVRGAEDRVVVAPGTSCREQISDGTGAHALHPAEYLANCLQQRDGRDGH